MTKRILSLSTLLISTLPGIGHAAPDDAPVVIAHRTDADIAIDGQLDELAWHRAPAANNFWQRAPHEGAPLEHRTAFRVLYDDSAIYIGVQAFDSEPHNINSLLTRRDEISPSDRIEVSIDSYHDRRTAFGFSLNPAGVQGDFLLFNDNEIDDSWDAIWTASAAINADGWVAEFRIPLNQLRFSSAPEQEWGLQVMRVVNRTKELSVWSPWPKESAQIVSRFGSIRGLNQLTPPRRVELLPFAVGGVHIARSDASGTGDAGIDVKYGVTSNLTVSATINPDFGQVEADPSQVNLTAEEIFFPEKRSFFLEGTDIFSHAVGDAGLEQLFYSRRIGAAPHYCAEFDDCVDAPSGTTIYGAAKLSGKTASGWSVGIFDAVTAEQVGTTENDAGEREVRVVEPLTNYAVLRLQKVFNRGRTGVGAALTSVHRALDNADLDWLHDQAYGAGLSFAHRFGQDRYYIDARLSGSLVHGSAEALERTQRASQRYFQRPDATHVEFDPTRTSLTGAGLVWEAGKNAGGRWRYLVGGDIRSPGLELNDIGFLKNSDQARQWLWGQYREDDPGPYLRSYNIATTAWGIMDWEPKLVETGVDVSGQVTLLNYWSAHGGLELTDDRWDNGALRGGPALRGDTSLRGWFGFSSDSRRGLRGGLNTSWITTSASDSWSLSLDPNLVIQARSNLDVGIGLSFARVLRDDQYLYEATDMSRHVLGRLDQTILSLTLRMNYTFTPTLTLQLYAQPFVSTGAYSDYKAATAPRALAHADRFEPAAASEVFAELSGPPDFNIRELRSNLVLRWEYRPGSTLFLVWSHQRDDSDDTGRFSLGDELAALTRASSQHTVLVKASYWYGL